MTGRRIYITWFSIVVFAAAPAVNAARPCHCKNKQAAIELSCCRLPNFQHGSAPSDMIHRCCDKTHTTEKAPLNEELPCWCEGSLPKATLAEHAVLPDVQVTATLPAPILQATFDRKGWDNHLSDASSFHDKGPSLQSLYEVWLI
jgi:hypothetical protein